MQQRMLLLALACCGVAAGCRHPAWTDALAVRAYHTGAARTVTLEAAVPPSADALSEYGFSKEAHSGILGLVDGRSAVSAEDGTLVIGLGEDPRREGFHVLGRSGTIGYFMQVRDGLPARIDLSDGRIVEFLGSLKNYKVTVFSPDRRRAVVMFHQYRHLVGYKVVFYDVGEIDLLYDGVGLLDIDRVVKLYSAAVAGGSVEPSPGIGFKIAVDGAGEPLLFSLKGYCVGDEPDLDADAATEVQEFDRATEEELRVAFPFRRGEGDVTVQDLAFTLSTFEKFRVVVQLAPDGQLTKRITRCDMFLRALAVPDGDEIAREEPSVPLAGE